MPTTTPKQAPAGTAQPGGACRYRSRRYAADLLAAANPASLTAAAKAQGTTVTTMTAVLVEIVNFDVAGSGKAWPSHRLLATRANRSLRTICRATKALETASVTTQAARKTPGPDGKRRRTSNLVRVNPGIAARHAHQTPDLEVAYNPDGTATAQQPETDKN